MLLYKSITVSKTIANAEHKCPSEWPLIVYPLKLYILLSASPSILETAWAAVAKSQNLEWVYLGGNKTVMTGITRHGINWNVRHNRRSLNTLPSTGVSNAENWYEQKQDEATQSYSLPRSLNQKTREKRWIRNQYRQSVPDDSVVIRFEMVISRAKGQAWNACVEQRPSPDLTFQTDIKETSSKAKNETKNTNNKKRKVGHHIQCIWHSHEIAFISEDMVSEGMKRNFGSEEH